MNTVIRTFALVVSFAGLASASFAPAPRQVRSMSLSVAATDPGPLSLPVPVPCQITGTCLVSPAATR
jgi:hypothetical protein